MMIWLVLQVTHGPTRVKQVNFIRYTCIQAYNKRTFQIWCRSAIHAVQHTSEQTAAHCRKTAPSHPHFRSERASYASNAPMIMPWRAHGAEKPHPHDHRPAQLAEASTTTTRRGDARHPAASEAAPGRRLRGPRPPCQDRYARATQPARLKSFPHAWLTCRNLVVDDQEVEWPACK